jgi:hypothetical protein
MEDALNLADEFGKIVLGEFLNNVTVFSNSKLVYELYEVLAPFMYFEVLANCSFFEEVASDLTLIVETLKRALKTVLFQSKVLAALVKDLVNLRKSSLADLFDDLVLSDLFPGLSSATLL